MLHLDHLLKKLKAETHVALNTGNTWLEKKIFYSQEVHSEWTRFLVTIGFIS